MCLDKKRNEICKFSKILDTKDTMKYITSLQNLEIKELVALQTVKGRLKYKKCLFQGLRTIETGLNSCLKLDKIYVTEENLSKIAPLVSPGQIILISEQVSQKIGTVKESSGLVATFFIPDALPIEQLSAGLVLAQVSDPGNMGTLIRTAAACGVKNVVVVDGVDAWNPKVIQATAGAIALVNIFDISWSGLVSSKKNLKLYGLVVENGSSITRVNSSESLIVVGNEAHGLPLEWQKECDYLVTLPMPGNTESLNASIAGSIALYLAYVKF